MTEEVVWEGPGLYERWDEWGRPIFWKVPEVETSPSREIREYREKPTGVEVPRFGEEISILIEI